MLVQLVWVGDTRHVESLGGADEGPEGGTVDLGNDVCGDTVATGVSTGGDLASDELTKLERLRNKDTRSLLELHKPLAALACPDVALVTMLVLELLGVGLSGFEGLEVVQNLDLLVEDLLLRVVPAEQLRL